MIVKESTIIYKEKNIPIKSIKLNNNKNIYKFVKYILGGANSPTEYLIVIALDQNAKPVSYIVLGCSAEDQVVFSLQSILRFVILSGYDNFITIHNHPDNSPKFSKEDISSTKELRKAAGVIGLNLVGDYLVLDGRCIRNKY